MLAVGGWALCAIGIVRGNRFLIPYLSRPQTRFLDPVKRSVVLAWPVAWLVVWFVVVNPGFAWSVLVAMVPTLLVLPVVLAGFRRPGLHPNVTAGAEVFLAIAVVVMLGSGLGIDRDFSRLEGHFILTVLLLFLWWDREATVKPVESSEGQEPAEGWFLNKVLLAIVIYHVGAGVLLLAAGMTATRYPVFSGILLGLLISTAWSVSLSRILISADRSAGYIAVGLPLAILFLTGPLVLFFGDVYFPLTLWQMEVGSSLIFAILWVGLALISQPLTKTENLLLAAVYLTYLGLRIYRFIS